MQYISVQYEVLVFLIGAGLASLVSFVSFIRHAKTKRRVPFASEIRNSPWQVTYMKRRGAAR